MHAADRPGEIAPDFCQVVDRVENPRPPVTAQQSARGENKERVLARDFYYNVLCLFYRHLAAAPFQ